MNKNNDLKKTIKGMYNGNIKFTELSEELRNNFLVAFYAVMQDIENYSYIGDELLNKNSDMTLIDSAVIYQDEFKVKSIVKKYNNDSMEFMIPRLFLYAEDNMIKHYITKEVALDRNIMANVIRYSSKAFEYVNDTWKKEVDFIFEVLVVNSSVAEYIDFSVFNNHELRKLISSYTNYWKHSVDIYFWEIEKKLNVLDLKNIIELYCNNEIKVESLDFSIRNNQDLMKFLCYLDIKNMKLVGGNIKSDTWEYAKFLAHVVDYYDGNQAVIKEMYEIVKNGYPNILFMIGFYTDSILNAIYYGSENVEGIILGFIRYNPRAILYATAELIENEEFMKKAIEMNEEVEKVLKEVE